MERRNSTAPAHTLSLLVCLASALPSPLPADPINDLYDEGLLIAAPGTQSGDSDLVGGLVVDLDGDGRDEYVFTENRDDGTELPVADLFIYGENDSGIFIYRNSHFLSAAFAPMDSNARQTTAEDFNGDGKLDLFLGDTGHENDCGPNPFECWLGGRNRLLLSNGSGTWDDRTDTHLPTGFSDFTHGSAMADFDNDGDVDIWVNNLGAGWPDFSYLLFNNGSGVFSVAADLSAVYSFMGTYVGVNGILPEGPMASGGWATAIDAEGDGDVDLLLDAGTLFDPQTGVTEYRHIELVNNGNGTFSLYPGNAWPRANCEASPVEPNPEICASSHGPQIQQRMTLDLDGDERQDAIFKQYLAGEEFVQILRSNPDQTFADETAARLGQFRGDGVGIVSLHDLDRDGHDDLFFDFENGQAHWASINLNDGEGNFRQLDQDWVSLPTGFWVVLDADGDGGTDFLTGRDGLVLHKMASPYGPNLDGGPVDDRLIGGANENILRGFDGDDILDGGLGDDQLDGGAGDDILIGGKGSDRYIYRSADLTGHDTINDKAGNADRLQFEDFGLEQVTLASQDASGGLILSFAAGGSITVENHFHAGTSGVEMLEAGGDTYEISRDPGFQSGPISSLLGAFEMNAGLNGNWWNGPARNGEGAQIEIAAAAGGGSVFVATVYSYDTMGNQIFLVAVGPVNGGSAEVDVFITDGGVWGEGFDPDRVNESQWGTGTFTAANCTAIQMELRPNAQFQALGFTDLAYDLVRLTTPLIACPFEG